MADSYAATVAMTQFKSGNALFMHEVDRLLACRDIAPEDRAAAVSGAIRLLLDKLRLMEW